MQDYFRVLDCEVKSKHLYSELATVAPWLFLERSRLYSCNVPFEMCDTIVKRLGKVFPCVPMLFRLPAGTFYAWHKDNTRKCALNLEVATHDSVTYFGEQSGNFYLNLANLPYSDRYVLLNTQAWHSVANLGSERIIFTLSFYQNSYTEVAEWLTQNKLCI